MVATLVLGTILNAFIGLTGYLVSFVMVVIWAVYCDRREKLEEAQRRVQQQQAIARQNEQAQDALDRFHRGQFNRRLFLQKSSFQESFSRWQNINGPLEKLLQPSSEDSSSNTINSDVTAYSFDRLIVCQNDLIAKLLIANNFHFENNCAVLSMNGYPQQVFETVMAMVRRNSELKVYAFHDCSPAGMVLLHQLRTSDRWFQNHPVTIIDAGLRPQQVIEVARASRTEQDCGFFVQQSPQSAQLAQQYVEDGSLSSENLSAEELEWLTGGYFVVLESFTPQKLIQVLNRSIAGSQRIEEENITDSGFVLIGDSFGMVYSAESFG